MRRILAALGAALVLAVSGAGVGTAAVAPMATSMNGVCEAGEACLFYNSGCQGSMIDVGYVVRDFAGHRFLSKGNGQGQPVKNNAASIFNFEENRIPTVYFNSGLRGPYDRVEKYKACMQLRNTYNENASLGWERRL